MCSWNVEAPRGEVGGHLTHNASGHLASGPSVIGVAFLLMAAAVALTRAGL